MDDIINKALPSLNARGWSGEEFFSNLIPSLIGILLVAGAIIFFFWFLLGAIQWTMSGGDKVSKENARNRVTNALVGLVVMLSLYAIVDLLETFFGVRLTTFDITNYFLGSN